MKNRFAGAVIAFVACLIFSTLMAGKPMASSMRINVRDSGVMVDATTPDCADCENRCEAWINKCKEGGQYACYKAAACLCKCNLDEGGCGSSKDALRECYEQNEKLARELGPPTER